MPEGTKHDQQKLRFDLIPPEAEEALARVLTFGAQKYGDRNWEKGINYSRLVAALRRHLNSWMSGELIDPETGESHLNHVLCNTAFLVAFEQRKQQELDDIHRDVVLAHKSEDEHLRKFGVRSRIACDLYRAGRAPLCRVCTEPWARHSFAICPRDVNTGKESA